MKETRIAADLVASKSINGYGSSAFVTDWALLGIKPIWRDAEHIVALDADTVDDRAYDGARLHWLAQATRRRSDGFLRDALSGHGRILARRGLWSIRSVRHPWDTKDASVIGERCWIRGQGEERAGRRINNAGKESRESRAALARMKYLGTFLTGVKQATDK